MRFQRIRQSVRPADVLFAFGRIGPLRLDPDIILCLPLGKRRIGRADSARGAAEELYDDAGQPGLHAVAMLDDQIDNLVAQAASKWFRAHFWRSSNMMAGGETRSIGRGDLRSNRLECAYFPQLRLGQTIFIRNLRDFADDPEDFGSCAISANASAINDARER